MSFTEMHLGEIDFGEVIIFAFLVFRNRVANYSYPVVLQKLSGFVRFLLFEIFAASAFFS